MEVRFWGTRGSLPTPGPRTVRFGGNTACVEVRTGAGHVFIFDCGTGARPLGDALTARAPLGASILFSPTHWDHIPGFPFFTPAFDPPDTIPPYRPPGGRPPPRTPARPKGAPSVPGGPIHDPQHAPGEAGDRRNGAHGRSHTVGDRRGAPGRTRPALAHRARSHDDATVGEIERHARAVAGRRGTPIEVFCAFEGGRVTLG